MTATLDARNFGRRCSQWFDRSLPKGAKIKRLADVIGQTTDSARRLTRGELPTTGQLIALARHFGRDFLDFVYGDVIGQPDLAARLDLLDRDLGALSNDLSRLAAGDAHQPSGLACGDLAAARRGGGERGPDGIAAGEGAERLRAAAAGGSDACALVSIRRADLAGEELAELRRHLTLGKVVSLDHARALVQGDNRGTTGVCFRNPGDDWRAFVAPENRLWTPSGEARPITAFAGDVPALRRDLDEAARSDGPVFATHAGAILRAGNIIPFHSTVARIGAKSPCGASVVVTDFHRLGARA